jgi:hypothetical protein
MQWPVTLSSSRLGGGRNTAMTACHYSRSYSSLPNLMEPEPSLMDPLPILMDAPLPVDEADASLPAEEVRAEDPPQPTLPWGPLGWGWV